MTVGAHIGQYRIVSELGSGGMGQVFVGEHVLLGRRAAIKTLLPVHAANKEIVERFFNEARATSVISDPGVIQIFDFGYHVDGTAYIVMELLEGEQLAARIDRVGKLPVAEALRIARQLASSLAAAHAHNIVHRDLKPENIFLVRDAEAQGGERPKVLDFGICKLIGSSDPSLTQVGTTFGTPGYMSPEQCRGLDRIDQRADVYALGCLMFHMLTGRPPFVGEAPGDYLVAHVRDEPVPPSAIVSEPLPAELDALVLRCLAKSPDARFQTMDELQVAIGALMPSVASAPAQPAVLVDDPAATVFDARLPVFEEPAPQVAAAGEIVASVKAEPPAAPSQKVTVAATKTTGRTKKKSKAARREAKRAARESHKRQAVTVASAPQAVVREQPKLEQPKLEQPKLEVMDDPWFDADPELAASPFLDIDTRNRSPLRTGIAIGISAGIAAILAVSIFGQASAARPKHAVVRPFDIVAPYFARQQADEATTPAAVHIEPVRIDETPSVEPVIEERTHVEPLPPEPPAVQEEPQARPVKSARTVTKRTSAPAVTRPRPRPVVVVPPPPPPVKKVKSPATEDLYDTR